MPSVESAIVEAVLSALPCWGIRSEKDLFIFSFKNVLLSIFHLKIQKLRTQIYVLSRRKPTVHFRKQ